MTFSSSLSTTLRRRIVITMMITKSTNVWKDTSAWLNVKRKMSCKRRTAKMFLRQDCLSKSDSQLVCKQTLIKLFHLSTFRKISVNERQHIVLFNVANGEVKTIFWKVCFIFQHILKDKRIKRVLRRSWKREVIKFILFTILRPMWLSVISDEFFIM